MMSAFGVVAVVAAVVNVAAGFNLAPSQARVLTGPKKTNFGYSVALWRDYTGTNRLVVGASRGTESYHANNTLPLGTIHVCNPSESPCPSIQAMPSLSQSDGSIAALWWGPGIARQGIGFGETLYTTSGLGSQREPSLLVACAPRYPRRMETFNTVSLQPRGACYLIKDTNQRPVKVLWESSDDRTNHQNVGFALHGFCAATSKDQMNVFVGGPNAFYGQGQILRAKTGDGTITSFDKNFYGPQTLDFTHEGWAVAVADYDGTKRLAVAASRPDWSNSRGSVSFFQISLRKQTKHDLTGSADGEHFGFSLAAGDVDGDGVDDLVVGAPLAKGDRGAPDAGKIYVFFAPMKVGSRTRQVREARQPWGQFGYTVACPGDLNQDGYQDVLVGAPWGRFGEASGAIYVYNGGPHGISTSHTQMITASEFGEGMRGFGFSINGGRDMDGNDFPDVIVGAPSSDTAVFIRTSPVVNLEGRAQFNPLVLTLGNKTCHIGATDFDSQDVECFSLVFDLEHSTKGHRNSFMMEFDLEVDPKYRRIHFMDSQDYRIKTRQAIYSTGNNVNWSLQLYVKPGKPRLDEPVIMRGNVTLIQDTTNTADSQGLARVPLVFNQLNPLSLAAQMRLKCDDPTVCYSKPDISLSVVDRQPVLVQSSGEYILQVSLQVKDDPAYTVAVTITYPQHFALSHVFGAFMIPLCREERAASPDRGKKVCTFTQNFREGEEVLMNLVFKYDALNLLGLKLRHLELLLEVESDSLDTRPDDNRLPLTLPVTTQADLQLEVLSDPDTVEGRLNETLTLAQVSSQHTGAINASDIGPPATHTAILTNRGPSPLLMATMVVSVPVNLPGGLPLFYIVQEVQASPSLACTQPPLNPAGFNISSTRPGQSSIGEGVLGQSTTPTPTMTPVTEAGVRSRRRAPDHLTSPPSVVSEPTVSTDPPSTKEMTRSKEKEMRELHLDCTNVQCFNVECSIGTLEAGQTVMVRVKGHVVVASVKYASKVSEAQSVTVGSTVNVTALQPNTTLNHARLHPRTHVTIVDYTAGPVSLSDLPAWKLFVAVIGGLMLIIVLTAVLCKLGFFKRKRLDEDQRREMKSLKRKSMRESKRESQRNTEIDTYG